MSGCKNVLDILVIPNADVFLWDIIKISNFDKNKRYPVIGFLEKLRPYGDIIIDYSNGSKTFSFGVSNGLRTLQDAGYIRTAYGQIILLDRAGLSDYLP